LNTTFLTSIAKTGAAKGVESLAKLLKVPVKVAKPANAQLMNLDEVITRLGQTDYGHGLALFLEVTGELEGKVLITFTQEDIARICRLIPRVPKEAGPEHPLVRSALLEMCNILASSFMSAIAEYTDLDYLANPPEMTIDMLDAVFISVLTSICQTSGPVVYFDTELIIDVERFYGKILYFPSPGAIKKMLSRGGK